MKRQYQLVLGDVTASCVVLRYAEALVKVDVVETQVKAQCHQEMNAVEFFLFYFK